jgi:hypothetical protein
MVPINGRQYDDRTTAALLYPTDVVTHVVNIDSRFRMNPGATLPTDFTVKMPRPFKNATSVRLASIEIPNVWYEFTSYKHNVSFSVTYNGQTKIITIPEGNYTDIDTLCATVQANTNAAFGLDNVTAQTNPATIDRFTVANDIVPSRVTFSNDMNHSFTITFPKIAGRAYDTGLGYNLGFKNDIYFFKPSFTSEMPSDIIGPNYILMHIDDYECVETLTFTDTTSTAFAKIMIQVPKNDVIYDTGQNAVSKIVRFPQPQNVATLRIRFTDSYGNTIVTQTNLSFTLEITEIVNSRLYETQRQRIPSNS